MWPLAWTQIQTRRGIGRGNSKGTDAGQGFLVGNLQSVRISIKEAVALALAPYSRIAITDAAQFLGSGHRRYFAGVLTSRFDRRAEIQYRFVG